jgi:hypothetical protein
VRSISATLTTSKCRIECSEYSKLVNKFRFASDKLSLFCLLTAGVATIPNKRVVTATGQPLNAFGGFTPVAFST